ncbi:MAG: biopolymer transporter ExbD [Bacteroidetes bacterium]|nr:biopolymer transporter ExbD [Bacteroidota bacterium]
MSDVQVRESRGKSKNTKKKKRRLGIRIDMTPMVDIAFLLLTFFMLTTTMSKPQTMEINLPPGESQVEVAASNLITLRITENFTIYWNVGSEKPEKIKFVELAKLLGTKSKANPRLITLIKVDRKAKYVTMVDIIDELNINNITRFSLAPMTDDDKKLIEKI